MVQFELLTDNFIPSF